MRFQFANRAVSKVNFLKVGLIWMMAIAFFILSPLNGLAQQPTPTGNQVDGYPVVLDGKELFRVRDGIPKVASAEERAKIITNRVIAVAQSSDIQPADIKAIDLDGESVVAAGDLVILTVRESDSKTLNRPRQELADQAVQRIRQGIEQFREERSFRQITFGILGAILATLALFLLFKWLSKSVNGLLVRIRAARQANRLDLRFQNTQILGSDATAYLLSGIIRLMSLILTLVALYLYIPFMLSQFPATKPFAQNIYSDISYRLNLLTDGFVSYLPNMITLGLIAFITYFAIQFAKLVIIELGRDNAYPWFYPEWVRPTIRLSTWLLIAIACVIAAPAFPGFGTPAFQGVSLFLGALLTIGSSSAVANAIAGIILIYTRAFRIGDTIRINEIVGQVIDKSIFVTRVLTFKKEIITIPNSAVLSSNVTNYRATERETSDHLVLHTTVTLGYDVPWRKIHEVLINAAEATPHILSEPSPFVLQTALNDYNVAYELNACTDRADLMPAIYSELHQNMQDFCNEAGIEILSPMYNAVRDGNHSTIPENYLPSDYQSPGFQIQRHS